MSRLPIFEKFGFPSPVEDERPPDLTELAAWRGLKRGDSFTLGGKQRWIVIRPLDGVTTWVIKEQQQGKRRRKDFVAQLRKHDASDVEIREGAGGDLHVVGPILDRGYVQDVLKENPDVNWLEEIADEGYGDFSDYYPASAAGEIEPSNPYYGKNVIWDGISGHMIRVYPQQAVAIDGNIFDPNKLAAIRDGIKEADNRVVFFAPYGTVSVVCPTRVKESIQYANDYPDHVKTTGDDDLDLWLSDLDSFLEEKGYKPREVEEWQRDPVELLDYCCDDDEDERAEKAQEMQEALELLSEMQVMLDEAVEKNEGDLGDFEVTVQDGNHRAFGALLSGEPYFYMILEDNQYENLDEMDPEDARIIDALE